MVESALDLDAVCEKMRVSLAQRRIARDLEGDVHEPELAAMRSLRTLRRRMLRNVERMEAVAQRHEHATVLGVLLRDLKTEHIAIKSLGCLLVRDPEENMANPSQFDHRFLPVVCCVGLGEPHLAEPIRHAIGGSDFRTR